MSNFTPQEIEEFLQEFFDVVGARQYVGARYVPIFGRAGEGTVEWDALAPYEPLTVVMHEGVSYVSRRYVPAGIDIADTAYWVQTYRFNAQVEQYRQEVLGFQGQINDRVPFPDADTYPRYGVEGQVLTTLADGTTKWDDPVVPSDAQAETVIDAWLEAHPEAVTTVEDGSISLAKLAADTRATLADALSVREPIAFDTTNKTVTFPTPTYVYVGKNMYSFETTTVVSYASITSTNRISIVVDLDNANALTAKAYNATGNWYRVFSFDATRLTTPPTNDIPCTYTVNGTTYQGDYDPTPLIADINTLKSATNILFDVPSIMSFDTTAQTLTIPMPGYLLVGKQRLDIESSDLVIDYSGVVGNMVTVVYDTSNASFRAMRYVDLAFSTQIPLFTFTKNGLLDPQTNNVFYPYFVDGTLVNGTDPTTYRIRYVDGVNGSDGNTGKASAPYKTIQKAINDSPNLIQVARGTYPETLTLDTKSNLTIKPWTTPSFNTSTFDVPMIVVNEVAMANCINVELMDIHANAPQANYGSYRVSNCYGVTFNHCWASNGEGGGFVTTNLYGKFVLCKAWDIGDSTHYNSDGFNLHGYGVTEFVDCIAHDCYDDGISHHDGCIASIKGGEFWNCSHGGGIAPINRYIEIDGAYCHDNRFGIESVQADPTQYDPYILIKNCVLDSNANYDLSIGEITCTMLRTSYTTKDVPAGATYKEIA